MKKRLGPRLFDGDSRVLFRGRDEGMSSQQCFECHPHRLHTCQACVLIDFISRAYFPKSDTKEILLHGRQDLGMFGHTQVVIRTPNSNLFLFLCSMPAGKLFCQPIDIVEVAVRLVLVFLV